MFNRGNLNSSTCTLLVRNRNREHPCHPFSRELRIRAGERGWVDSNLAVAGIPAGAVAVAGSPAAVGNPAADNPAAAEEGTESIPGRMVGSGHLHNLKLHRKVDFQGPCCHRFQETVPLAGPGCNLAVVGY